MTVFQNEQDIAGMLKKVYTGSFQNPRQNEVITLQAGEFKTLSITYSSFMVSNNTAPAAVTFDFGQMGRPTYMEQGQGFSLPFAVNKLTLHNTGNSAATIDFSYGMADLYDNRTAITGTVTTTERKNTSAQAQSLTIAAGDNTSATVNGHVLIQNNSANNTTTISIFDADGLKLAKLGSFEGYFNGTISIYNDDTSNAATVSVVVLS